MSVPFNIYWGEMHQNTHLTRENPPLEDIVAFASSYLDFYTGAYYTAFNRKIPVKSEYRQERTWNGLSLESIKSPEKLITEWNEFQHVSRHYNRPGSFVMFPGYEWQGDGRWGDHNVVYFKEGHPICTAKTLAGLYSFLKDKEAIAIPHHTGYNVGLRAPTWSLCDENISPFAEIYSAHGCSETDEEWVGLRVNTYMGPGVSGGTYQDALNLGLHLGAICSGDNADDDDIPGQWNRGVAACLASELTRKSLWEAFKARRVYGVTGDRIRLSFTVNGRVMGSILDPCGKRDLSVHVEGTDAIDRIEILRNGRVIATHCHQGTWALPLPGQRTKFKMRIEVGWGSRADEMPLSDQHWKGCIQLASGIFRGWSPCWIAGGQKKPVLDGNECRFEMQTSQRQAHCARYNANIFEFESDPASELQLKLDGLQRNDSILALAQRSCMLWDKTESMKRIEKLTGMTPDMTDRNDLYYYHAWKAKIHTIVPESGYTATFSITDDQPLEKECHYRVRVEQRNGQRAWSSPIWVKAGNQ